jgi:hypothetical protein
MIPEIKKILYTTDLSKMLAMRLVTQPALPTDTMPASPSFTF